MFVWHSFLKVNSIMINSFWRDKLFQHCSGFFIASCIELRYARNPIHKTEKTLATSFSDFCFNTFTNEWWTFLYKKAVYGNQQAQTSQFFKNGLTIMLRFIHPKQSFSFFSIFFAFKYQAGIQKVYRRVAEWALVFYYYVGCGS